MGRRKVQVRHGTVHGETVRTPRGPPRVHGADVPRLERPGRRQDVVRRARRQRPPARRREEGAQGGHRTLRTPRAPHRAARPSAHRHRPGVESGHHDDARRRRRRRRERDRSHRQAVHGVPGAASVRPRHHGSRARPSGRQQAPARDDDQGGFAQGGGVHREDDRVPERVRAAVHGRARVRRRRPGVVSDLVGRRVQLAHARASVRGQGQGDEP
mmetsp:Transcript_9509/g.34609  ORF Transcript_9509/g.34609 Transcript_9509/m.34609 type:complete len:214 (+) Transcript_9509:1219-1860(+)